MYVGIYVDSHSFMVIAFTFRLCCIVLMFLLLVMSGSHVSFAINNENNNKYGCVLRVLSAVTKIIIRYLVV